ncbi:MAG: sulfurtransferase TusA family protein [Aquificaceae bacterium]
MRDLKADIVHDVTGTFCPVPVAETARIIKTMSCGQILELIADDPGVVEDIPSWCKSTGNEFLGLYQEDEQFHLFVRKLK